MSDAVKYTPHHIDGLIRATTKQRALAMRQQQAQAAKQAELAAIQAANAEHEGFCMKCKDKRSVITAGIAEHKNGMKSLHGECPDCGSSVHRFHKKEPADG